MAEMDPRDRIAELEKRVAELEKARAEKAARFKYLSEIVETSGNAINSVDLDGIITSWNPASDLVQ